MSRITKPTHGGPRENAGRKAPTERPHAVKVMLSDAELQWLDACVHKRGVSRAEILRRALMEYLP